VRVAVCVAVRVAVCVAVYVIVFTQRYGVASVSRIDKIIGLLSKRAL